MLKLVVLSYMMAAATASVLAPFAPLGYTAPPAYASPVLAPYGSNYRGPLSLAPGQPTHILAADGRPHDNLDRSAHFNAKALSGIHYLKKRSAPLIAPLGHVAPSPLIHSEPLAFSAPVLSLRLAVAPIAYSATPIAHYTHW